MQLCLENYYDDTIFHRVIKEAFVQGGDPTNTGTGGDSIYGEPFKDEFHTRLRFSHRGIVAMASPDNKRNANRSQFIMTLGKTEWLQGHHTIFGKVTGDTVFNLVKIGETETDKQDRPLYPPKIISAEVLWNPFDDIQPREWIVNQRNEAKRKAEEEANKKNQKVSNAKATKYVGVAWCAGDGLMVALQEQELAIIW